MSSMLLLSNRRIQQYFLVLLAIHMSLGCIRFLFPFQILNLGGDEILNQYSSTLFAGGQILGFLFVAMIFKSNRSRLFFGGVSLLLLMLIMGVSNNPIILAISRTFEGLGYGLLFMAIISIATQFPDREGEVMGGLFAAILSGSAIGQGIAGLLWNFLLEVVKLSSIQSIQFISYLATLITLISLILLYISFKPESKPDKGWKLPHLHAINWIRTAIAIPSIGVLMIIYCLYDFAHGLYTPNLSILLVNQGISEVLLGFGYLAGDITWGISQIFAGKIVDRIGHPVPLILSLLLKGVVVVFYPGISIFLSLIVVLVLAGLMEGFLEPSRNKAALSIEKSQEFAHTHNHLDMGFSSSGSFAFSVHKHEHNHQMKSETIVGTLQATGVVFLGLGSLVGSWLLIQDISLEVVTIIGGIFLIIASIFSIIFSLIR